MNKPELVKVIAKDTGLSPEQVRSVIDSFSAIIFQKCREGEPVQICKFGTFRLRTFSPHKFTHFKEKNSVHETAIAPASSTVHFTCSRTFKRGSE